MTIEQQALALVNEVRAENGHPALVRGEWGGLALQWFATVCLALERHEAFRQEVSEAVTTYLQSDSRPALTLSRFIIAPPVDPLVEAVKEAWPAASSFAEAATEDLRAALAKHGLAIRKDA